MPDPSHTAVDPVLRSRTADLCDDRGETVASCTTQLRQLGGRRHFGGVVSTVRCDEDSAVVKEVLGEPGAGRVLVVDGGGSLRRALLGDVWAGTAMTNGWEGVVVHGAVRDSEALALLDVGVKALGTSPRRSTRNGSGQRDVRVAFGDVVFSPGDLLVSDDDGIVVLPTP